MDVGKYKETQTTLLEQLSLKQKQTNLTAIIFSASHVHVLSIAIDLNIYFIHILAGINYACHLNMCVGLLIAMFHFEDLMKCLICLRIFGRRLLKL
jgi:hypothetical protein